MRILWILVGLIAWIGTAPLALAAPSAGVPSTELVRIADPGPPDVPEGWVRVDRVGLSLAGPPSDAARLEALADHASEALPRLADALGVPVGGRIHGVLASDETLFHTLQPGRPPAWADATAWPGHGWIFLRNPDLRGGMARPLEQVLDHELVHILLGRAFAPAPVPSWLQEGTAQVLAGEAGPELPARLRRGLAVTGRSMALADLVRGFPADPARADLAYALSADFIHHLRRTHGEDALRRIVRAGAAGRGLDVALREVTGQSVDALDAAWQATLPTPTSAWMTPEVMDAALWTGAAALVGGVGALRLLGRRRRTRSAREEAASIRTLAREILVQRSREHTR